MIGTLIAKSKIRTGFSNLNNHDIDKFLTDWAEEAIFVYPGNISMSGEHRGKKAIGDWFKTFMVQFPNIKFTIKHVCVQSIFDLTGTNNIAVEWDVNLTNKDGKEIQNSGVTTLELRMGKVILVRDYIFYLERVKEAWGEE